MNHSRCFWIVIILFFLVFQCGSRMEEKNRDVVFQVSTMKDLLHGFYDGVVTFQKLKNHGNFGLGTFHRLDGEMIAFEGTVYQVQYSGDVFIVPDTMTTPFACVTFFEPDEVMKVSSPLDFQGLKEELRSLMRTQNVIHAVKVDGVFSSVKTRSIAAQKKPYYPLLDVLKSQSVFEFHDVKGTIVGFWMPQLMKNIHTAGFHLHFITEDRNGGGHLLDCQLMEGKIALDYSSGFYFRLLENEYVQK